MDGAAQIRIVGGLGAMSVAPNAEQNRSSGIDFEPSPKVKWRILRVEPRDDFTLAVEFVDGTRGVVMMSDLIHAEDAGVFAALRDPEVFSAVYLQYGAVTWPGELDLAPDAMYDEIKVSGRWTLR
jgi:hypothetical protein